MLGRIRMKGIFQLASCLMALALLASCSGSSGGGRGPGTLNGLEISPTAVLLRDAASSIPLTVYGVSTTLKKTDLTASASGTVYSTSDPLVASVTTEGVVGAVGPGTATITADNGGFMASVPVYSDYAPALTEGDFDLVAPAAPVPEGKTVTIPLVLEAGNRTFGSYRVRVTFDPTHFVVVQVAQGSDLGQALAARTDNAAGEVEILDTYDPSLGQTLTGQIEAVRIVLRAIGTAGQASIVTGEALGVSDDTFPAAPLGAATPRPFITGVRWMVIE